MYHLLESLSVMGWIAVALYCLARYFFPKCEECGRRSLVSRGVTYTKIDEHRHEKLTNVFFYRCAHMIEIRQYSLHGGRPNRKSPD